MAIRPEKRVLIFRRGSIGDTIVSLPALNAIAEAFPNAERRILTNSPTMEVAAPLQSIVDGTGLVHGYFVTSTRSASPSILKSRREIRVWKPDIVIYLSEPSSPARLLAEILFFWSCGIGRFMGIPLGLSLRRYRKSTDNLWESESERLMRAIGPIDTGKRDWSLNFPQSERDEAARRLDAWPGFRSGSGNFIAFSVGAKLSDKDWGDVNWRAVLAALAANQKTVGIIAFGADEDRERSQALLEGWPGPTLNLCGETSPRVGALMMGKAAFYLGHDSGPMHLAALGGTRCVAVFAARAKPGVWFPHGEGHLIFYPWDFAAGVPATPGFRHGGNSIRSIDPKDVAEACLSILKERTDSVAATQMRR